MRKKDISSDSAIVSLTFMLMAFLDYEKTGRVIYEVSKTKQYKKLLNRDWECCGNAIINNGDTFF